MATKVVLEVEGKTVTYPPHTETFWETSDGKRHTTEEKANAWQRALDRLALLENTVYKTLVEYDTTKFYYVKTIEELQALAGEVGASPHQVDSKFTTFSPQWVVVYPETDYTMPRIYPAKEEIEEITALYTALTKER